MRLVWIGVVLALCACKRPKRHERVEPTGAGDVWGEAIDGDARAPDVDEDSVAAGSLVSDRVEVWYALILPVAATDATAEQLANHAARYDAKDWWFDIRASTLDGVGFVAGDDGPRRIGSSEVDAAGTIVMGGGAPGASADALLATLGKLTLEGAIALHGWILDTHSYVLYTPEEFQAGPLRDPRDVEEQITVYTAAEEGFTILYTAGLARFGLPELQTHAPLGDEIEQWVGGVNEAAQTLVDRGGLAEDGVLATEHDRWTATWAETDEGEPRVIVLALQ